MGFGFRITLNSKLYKNPRDAHAAASYGAAKRATWAGAPRGYFHHLIACSFFLRAERKINRSTLASILSTSPTNLTTSRASMRLSCSNCGFVYHELPAISACSAAAIALFTFRDIAFLLFQSKTPKLAMLLLNHHNADDRAATCTCPRLDLYILPILPMKFSIQDLLNFHHRG